MITAAEKMDVPYVNTFMGGDAALTQDANWERALEVWPDIVRLRAGPRAEDHHRELPDDLQRRTNGRAATTSPGRRVIWRRILEQWGGTIGLNFDPSHLVWLMIDQTRFIREFGPHILHVQAKDLTIDRDGLYERGTLSSGIGWQVPRLPGLGDVDWARFPPTLYRAGYDGDIIIEHEDRGFEATDELDQARLPARPRRPASVYQVSGMTLSIDDLTERDVAKTIDHSPAQAGAGRRVRRGRLPAGGRVRRRERSASARSHVRRAGAILAGTDVKVGTVDRLPARQLARPRRRSSRPARRSADGATELDMVIQIGALKSGRDAEVQADIAAVVDVAHARRRDRQGHLRERLPDRRREDPGLPPDRGRRRRFRQDLDRVRARRRDPRRPAR